MIRLAPLVLALAAIPAFGLSTAHAADYVQAAGSTLTFATKYQGDVFVGRFPAFTTRLSFDPKALPASKLDVAIPLAGAATGDGERDSSLKGSDFFNVAKFPQARFVSTKFRALGGNRYAADGQLTLRGLSRPVTLAFTWTPGAKPVLAGQATVKRLDFGVGGGDWADTGLIPNEVAVSTRVVFAPAAR
ncbi:MAG TPA: YceI family protein [Lysobacter sp.]|nr:YceI family protein [Lysobacter sp.]